VLPCLDFTLKQKYGCEYHMMKGAGSSLTQTIPSYFMCLDGPTIKNEKSCKSHENPNNIPRL
jgi:hypothetical protein